MITDNYLGGDLASTRVTTPEVHTGETTQPVNKVVIVIVANDDNYALAA